MNAVNLWIYLSKEVENPFIQRCLMLFIDSHMYNIKWVDQTGVFKNIHVVETDVTDDIISNVVMDVLPPHKQGKEKNKILHALTTSLTQRCQIRNLKEIIISYVSEDDAFFNFL